VIALIGFLTCGVLSPLGLALSWAGLSKEPRGLAVAGTVLGGLGSLWVLGVLVFFALFLLSVVSASLVGQ
jgi:hypothetical protein